MSVFAASMLAFVVVMVLLSLMALFMAALTRIFPPPAKVPAAAAVQAEPGVASAISQAVNAAFPGSRVSNIRELPR